MKKRHGVREISATNHNHTRTIKDSGQEEEGGERRQGKKEARQERRKDRGGTYIRDVARTARVWSINHSVFPATGGHRGRWRGHIIGRIVPVCWSTGRHGRLSCRDRPAIDGSPRFELTPVKSRVARCHGKSCRAPLIDTGYYFPLVTRPLPPPPFSPFYQLFRADQSPIGRIHAI